MIRILSALICVLFFWAPAWAQNIPCQNVGELLLGAVQETGCRHHQDCASVDLPPQFGCHVPMSKPAAFDVINILEAYKSGCGPLLYTCYGPPPRLECNKRTCVIAHRGAGPRFPSVGAYDSNGRPLKY